MDADRFDAMVQSLTGIVTRRGIIRALAGLGLTGTFGTLPGLLESRAKKGKKKKKCKGKKTCGGTCIPKANCCTDNNCISGQICVQGRCVTGQGTCLSGANFCANGNSLCSGGDCQCYTTMDNETRCGISTDNQTCGRCINDAQCAAIYPGIPGVFCANQTQANCGCSPGLPGVCMAPCPSLSG